MLTNEAITRNHNKQIDVESMGSDSYNDVKTNSTDTNTCFINCFNVGNTVWCSLIQQATDILQTTSGFYLFQSVFYLYLTIILFVCKLFILYVCVTQRLGLFKRKALYKYLLLLLLLQPYM